MAKKWNTVSIENIVEVSSNIYRICWNGFMYLLWFHKGSKALQILMEIKNSYLHLEMTNSRRKKIIEWSGEKLRWNSRANKLTCWQRNSTSTGWVLLRKIWLLSQARGTWMGDNIDSWVTCVISYQRNIWVWACKENHR